MGNNCGCSAIDDHEVPKVEGLAEPKTLHFTLEEAVLPVDPDRGEAWSAGEEPKVVRALEGGHYISVNVDSPVKNKLGEGSPTSTSDEEALVAEERRKWDQEQERLAYQVRQAQLQGEMDAARRLMREDTTFGTHRPANRYGTDAQLPVFTAGRHVPVLGLINPMSGAMAGQDILSVCKRQAYYQDRMFNIIDVIKGQHRGGLMDVFRVELNRVRDEAKAMKTRPRLISGGGDGTGSFALFIVFLALKADASREEDGLRDTGNGFIWTDEDMSESFPALAQMPLGSANDFANILGWGQKYPGSKALPCTSHAWSARMLYRWFDAVISPTSQVANFDLWGIMPPHGESTCDFKLAELVGDRGRCPNNKIKGRRHVHLKEAGKPVPFFVCLYFSAGFGAYMTARFQLNRHKTPVANRLEYARQAIGIIREPTPPQVQLRLNGVEIDCEGQPYFPPRRDKGNKGRGYREVGFYNINWQAHALHGADRANALARLCSSRKPVTFNDGYMDMFRWKFMSLLKNPGFRVQTDKRREMLLKYTGKKGQGVFFQWDGEARFAFSTTGAPFHIYIRKVMNIPVVLGPYIDPRVTGQVDNGEPVRFEFSGSSHEERELVRRRTLQNVRGELDAELNASHAEIADASFPLLSL